MEPENQPEGDRPAMRERILRESARLFSARGYDGLSMREIAAACGLSKAGLYYHFENKEDLFIEIMENSLAQLARITTRAAEGPGSAAEKIGVVVRGVFLELPADQREVIRLANQELDRLGPEKRAAFTQQYHERFLSPLAEVLRQGAASGELREADPHMAVWALLGLMYPFFSPRVSQPGEVEAVVRFILTLFFEGMNRDAGV